METEILTKYEEVQNALAAVDDVLESISLLDNISSAGELHETMPRLLASLGHYSLSDRAYIFSWVSEERTELHMVHEWCAEGVRPTMDEMQHVRMEDMPHWAFSLYNGAPHRLHGLGCAAGEFPGGVCTGFYLSAECGLSERISEGA